MIDFKETNMKERSIQIGQKIRYYRKLKHLTLTTLANKIYKTKSTLSKYEKGEIVIDIETLYDIADVLDVSIEELLLESKAKETYLQEHLPSFFEGISYFYSYVFDGRNNKILRCRFDILSKEKDNRYKIMMYMNFINFNDYQNCETTYYGYMEHYDALTNIMLVNKDSPIEKASAHILASYLTSDTKYGIFNGISSRPLMPIATKMLFSREPIKEDHELINKTKISKEDIKLLKMYNMLSIM